MTAKNDAMFMLSLMSVLFRLADKHEYTLDNISMLPGVVVFQPLFRRTGPTKAQAERFKALVKGVTTFKKVGELSAEVIEVTINVGDDDQYGNKMYKVRVTLTVH